ncbi:deoxyribonuclease nucA nucB domain-containing [Fusarium albosuccineum]|uniref:Deoxyribonuclease nucA nucB domain-containing n=1 Tax=Fusarium albosuccineum TaxID=1237068 RepID=A0A8H4P4C4_9HYPO|nr:deoxyribonuclease nucA nucB domain-containing [Fusarium albosuccineum]
MSFKSLVLVAAVAWLGATPQVTAAPPDLTFLCNKIPEICSNICWATRCASPKFSLTLTYDQPSASIERSRRRTAGCGSNNRCTKRGKGVGRRLPVSKYGSCDEYPFASTRSNGKQVSRCAPKSQNNSQGGSISAALRRLKKTKRAPFQVRVGLGNPGSRGVKWCSNQRCKNDGYQVQEGKLKKREEEPSFRFYKTESGMVLATLDDIDPMSNFTHEVDESDLKVRPRSLDTLDTWTEKVEGADHDVETMRYVNDMVLGEMTSEEITNYLAPLQERANVDNEEDGDEWDVEELYDEDFEEETEQQAHPDSIDDDSKDAN